VTVAGRMSFFLVVRFYAKLRDVDPQSTRERQRREQIERLKRWLPGA